MTDDELRDKLADKHVSDMNKALSEVEQANMPHTIADDAFRAGWKAARANDKEHVQILKQLVLTRENERDNLRAERDECVKRVVTARNEVAALNAEVERLKAMCENLVKCLEELSNYDDGPPYEISVERMKEIAADALAEYRKEFDNE